MRLFMFILVLIFSFLAWYAEGNFAAGCFLAALSSFGGFMRFLIAPDAPLVDGQSSRKRRR
jgi:hypothetical protein